MANYQDDREFTDYIHQKISIAKIYPIMGWQVKTIDDELNRIDMHKGIDAVVTNINGSI